MSTPAVEPLKRLAYSVRELAEATGLSDQSIYDAIKNGDLPARFIGTKRVVPVDAAEAWLASLPEEPPVKS